VFAATFFWGTTATLARFVFRDRHVPALTVVELRLVFAAALLGPWLAWRHPDKLYVARRDWGYLLVLGVVGLAGVQGSYYYSISVLGVGLAILLQYLAPSLIVIYQMARGARVAPMTVAAALGAVAGTALLVWGIDRTAPQPSPMHWAIGFSSSLLFAFYILFTKRGLTRYAPETLLFYTFSIAAVVWACVTPPWKIVRAGYGPDLWGLFAVLGAFSTLVPFVLFNAGLRRLAAPQAGIIATLEPVVAVASSALILGEGLRPVQYLGAVLVLGAAMLAPASAEPGSPDPRSPPPLSSR
jgi:drug/metabolite transporter (DMT)-like permease